MRSRKKPVHWHKLSENWGKIDLLYGGVFSVFIRTFLIPKHSSGKVPEIKHKFFSFIVINGHTPCLRLLLEVADNPDVTDAKGQ